jgi:hypothetical protein
MDRDAQFLRRLTWSPAMAAVMARRGVVAARAGKGERAPHGRDDVEPGARQPLYARALLIWPRLDRARLARTRGDPRKVARLVARRTIHSEESILSLLRSG